MRKSNQPPGGGEPSAELSYLRIGESQGTKWKGGNPYPSPFFDRVREDSPALIAMDKFAGGKGLGGHAASGRRPAHGATGEMRQHDLTTKRSVKKDDHFY